MPSPWDDTTIALQEQIAMRCWYAAGGQITGEELAAAINADPVAISKRDGSPREIGRHAALQRAKSGLRAQPPTGDLAGLRAEFVTQLRFALDKVMARVAAIDELDKSAELKAVVDALVTAQREIADHHGLHRLAPVEMHGEVEDMTDEQLVRVVLESISTVDLAVLAPDVVRAAADELARLESS